MSAAWEERPVEVVREEHYRRIRDALNRLRDPEGMARLLDARYLKNGEGSWTNAALMAEQAPGQMVENHYGWVNLHGILVPKDRTADVFLSDGRMLPKACWSQLRLGLGGDYLETRGGGPIPEWDGDYCRMLAASWSSADDPEATPGRRVRRLNRWALEVEPRGVEGTPLDRPALEDAIPF
jgi:hypothetical protein